MKRLLVLAMNILIMFSIMVLVGCDSNVEEQEQTAYEIEQMRIKTELEDFVTKSGVNLYSRENLSYTIDLQDSLTSDRVVVYGSVSDIYRKDNKIILVINTFHERFELDCTDMYQEIRDVVIGDDDKDWTEYAFLINIESIDSALKLEREVEIYSEDDYEATFNLDSIQVIKGNCLSVTKFD